MKSGYVRFGSPIILHGGLQGFSHHFSDPKYEELHENGAYLAMTAYLHDSPPILKNERFYFSGKYRSRNDNITGYLIMLEGYPVVICDMSPKEEHVSLVPSDLFEI